MGVRNQTTRRRRLVDMALQPVAGEAYEPPPAGDERTWDIDLGDECRGHALIVIDDHHIVWFVLTQWYSENGDEPVQIARVDCTGGTVHEHRFDRSGRDVLDHRVIAHIPSDDGPKTVHQVWDRVYDEFLSNWTRNFELWRTS